MLYTKIKNYFYKFYFLLYAWYYIDIPDHTCYDFKQILSIIAEFASTSVARLINKK